MKDLSNIKIIFCDIDGTLVDDNKKISNHTKESIKKVTDKGINFILVSGRDYFHVIERVKELESTKIFISSGGALIYDASKEKPLYEDHIDSKKVESIIEYCNNYQIGVLVRSLSGKYYNSYFKDVNEEFISKDDILITNKTNIDKLNASQLLILSNDKGNALMAKNHIKFLGLDITNSSASFLDDERQDLYYFDVNNKNISKGPAINFLLEKLNIKKEESLCFGDFTNDLDMFDVCGIGVAMENATEQLKQKADYITDSNNDDGVANFLDKYL